jgi:O-antigen/teichoic acid export membrane protein
LAAAKFISVLHAAQDVAAIRPFWSHLLRQAWVVGGLVACGVLALSPLLMWFLNVGSINLWALVAIGATVSFVVPVNIGVLQGLQRFKALAAANLGPTLIKLVGGPLMVGLGLGVVGAFVPILIGLVAVGSLTMLTMRHLPKASSNQELPSVKRYLGWTSVAFAGFVVLTNVDVLLAKHHLTATESGAYAAVAVLGRIVLFAPAVVSMVMFPKAAAAVEQSTGAQRILAISLGATVTLASVITIAYWLLPTQIVNLTMGADYIQVAPLIAPFGLAMGFMALTFVLMHYYLATGRTRVGLAILLAVLAHVALASVYNDDPEALTKVRLVSSGVGLIAMVAYGRIRWLKQHLLAPSHP